MTMTTATRRSCMTQTAGYDGDRGEVETIETHERDWSEDTATTPPIRTPGGSLIRNRQRPARDRSNDSEILHFGCHTERFTIVALTSHKSSTCNKVETP
ncbi:hypothetical protein CC2G_004393 [Coprinopsis cinerea AmutBmut pab1-1]|nr:hypothetical protein CC2G_004393 [Coprinopsis cinerea AmutBmut pab1-1]